MRLIVTYVMVAVMLVLLVGAAITAFALSNFALGTNATVADVAREAPEVVQRDVAEFGSLERAASEIARQLKRPGVHIVVTKNSEVLSFAGDGAPGRWTRTHSPGQHFPFRLNLLLGLHPKTIEIPGGEITIFPDAHPLERAIGAFWTAVVPVGILAAALAFVLGSYITDQALRPLMETTQSLRRFSAGNFSPRPIVAEHRRDEIGELAIAYNGAAAQVAAAFDERAKAEIEMRQFIADAGHELRTPLTVIMGFIEVLSRRSSGDATTTHIYETMAAESRRMKALVEKLILLARLENPEEREHGEIDLDEIVSRVVTSLSALTADPSRIRLRADPHIVVRANENEIHDAVGNLIENALKYAPESPVEVRVRAENGCAIVEVADRGPGLSEEERAHVFDRFYRGRNREQSEGFGLGLAIAKRAVERADGEIALATAPGEGCRFTIRLPLVALS